MNLIRQIAFGALAGCATVLFAQSSPSPSNRPEQTGNAQSAPILPAASPSPSVAVEPPSLIPPNILPGPGAAGLPQIPLAPDLQMLNALFKHSSLGKAADEYQLHLQMAGLETRIRNDEELHELKAAANRAPTDLERRHRLKTYYQVYCKKLLALASTPELKGYVKAQEATHESRLLQPRVRHETDEAEASALAQAAGGANAAAALPTPVQARASDALQNP